MRECGQASNSNGYNWITNAVFPIPGPPTSTTLCDAISFRLENDPDKETDRRKKQITGKGGVTSRIRWPSQTAQLQENAV
jgi:hypothetical protein